MACPGAEAWAEIRQRLAVARSGRFVFVVSRSFSPTQYAWIIRDMLPDVLIPVPSDIIAAVDAILGEGTP